MPDTLTLIFWLVVAVYLWYAVSYYYSMWQAQKARERMHNIMEEL